MSRFTSWLFGSPEKDSVESSLTSMRYDDVSSSDSSEADETPPAAPPQPPPDVDSTANSVLSFLTPLASRLTGFGTRIAEVVLSEPDESELSTLLDVRFDFDVVSCERADLEDLFNRMLGRQKIAFLESLAKECHRSLSLASDGSWEFQMKVLQKVLGSSRTDVDVDEIGLKKCCEEFDVVAGRLGAHSLVGKNIVQISENGIQTATSLGESSASSFDGIPAFPSEVVEDVLQHRLSLIEGVITSIIGEENPSCLMRKLPQLGEFWILMILTLFGSTVAHWSSLMTNEKMHLLVPSALAVEGELSDGVTTELAPDSHVVVKSVVEITSPFQGLVALVIDELSKTRLAFSHGARRINEICDGALERFEKEFHSSSEPSAERIREGLKPLVLEKTLEVCTRLVAAETFARAEILKVGEAFHEISRYCGTQFGGE